MSTHIVLPPPSPPHDAHMQTLLYYYYYYYCYYYSVIFVTLYCVKRVNIVLERTREGHRQSDEDWYCFKGNVGETFELSLIHI